MYRGSKKTGALKRKIYQECKSLLLYLEIPKGSWFRVHAKVLDSWSWTASLISLGKWQKVFTLPQEKSYQQAELRPVVQDRLPLSSVESQWVHICLPRCFILCVPSPLLHLCCSVVPFTLQTRLGHRRHCCTDLSPWTLFSVRLFICQNLGLLFF